MSDTNADQILEKAATVIERETDPPMSLREFIDLVLEDSSVACSASEYLLRAIEHFGTRSVTEHGQEIERYRFFDDPANNGEHAILGNTKLLNGFVSNIRQMARGDANEEKMFWFEGPTATGKSELKRCLVNGLNAFSKTDKGRRFTIEWNVVSDSDPGSMTYGDTYEATDEEYWYESPVQSNPLSLLPENIRRQILYGDDSKPSKWLPPGLDPFSQEAYDILDKKYNGEFEKITDPRHLRVVRYNLDIGKGIGSIQSEDEGRPNHKLVGQWMPGMVKELDSRGRRNPQALSYDGVLSQGNNGLTVVEDAGYHFETIQKMLSVPEDDEVKIDRRQILPIDTVVVIISNPDMRNELMKTTNAQNNDSYRPIRRRLTSYEIKYLVTPSIEAELLYRLLAGYESVWDDGSDRIGNGVVVNGIELAPHALEAAAFFDVSTRMSAPKGLTRIEKAMIYDGEEIEVDGDVYDAEYFEEHSDGHEGRTGIPCTFTRDTIADLISDKRDSEDENVIMPLEVLGTMDKSLDASAVFSSSEVATYQEHRPDVEKYIVGEQEEDVLDAMLREYIVSDDEIEEYVTHVHCWGTDEDTVEPDDLKMQVFETEHLGRFDDSHYNLNTKREISDNVYDFRQGIISGISAYVYEHRGEDFEVDLDDVPLAQFPELEELVEGHDWHDVYRIFDDLDLTMWENPPSKTETAAVKENTVENMVDMFGYTEESARMTSEQIVKRRPRIEAEDE